jgi:tripartite-type tricarboxylate transporter receptor subunit TctC
VGTPGHLAGEMLKLKLDDKLVHVPYKGAGPALSDIAGGQVEFFFSAYPSAVPLTQSGRIRLLAVSTVKRSPAAPGIPTVAETTGIADFDFKLWVGFFGPRGLPMPIANKLNAAINTIISEPATMARLHAIGATITPLSIDEFAGFVRADIARYRAIIDRANLRVE